MGGAGPAGASEPGGGCRAASAALIAVLDTGGVEALVSVNARSRARLRALREQVSDLVVPAAVLAEGVFTGHPGHDFHLRRLLAVFDVAPLDRDLGLEAGVLRRQALREDPENPPSAVDAVVVAVADALAARDDVVMITSDPDDLELLGSFATHADRISVQPA